MARSHAWSAGNLMKEVYTNPVFGGFSNFDDTFRDRITCFFTQVARLTQRDRWLPAVPAWKRSA